MTLWDRMTSFNERLNNLPRKAFLITLVLLCCYIVVASFPLFAPFFVAAVVAMLMNPLVKLLRKLMMRFKFKNAVSSLLAMLLVYGIIGWASFRLVHRLYVEISALVQSMPQIIDFVRTKYNELITLIMTNFAEYLPANFQQLASDTIGDLIKSLTSFAGTASRYIAGGAFATATSLPEIILTIVLTIMGTFYLSYDKERIFAFFKRSFPPQIVKGAISLKENIFSSVFGQVKSQLFVSLLVTITVILGMLVMRRPYGLVVGLIIGIADALPVIGAGLFLITWSIFAFVTGDTVIGIGMLVLYLFVILVRQVSEPRIVGHNLGLYPLATMMALYAGYKLMGFLGMLAGPIILNVLKVIIAADDGLLQPVEKTLHKPRLFWKKDVQTEEIKPEPENGPEPEKNEEINP